MRDSSDNRTMNLPGVPEERRGRGRPRLHVDKAAKQRAYRARQKAAGMRVVSRVVRDVRALEAPLHSDIIDLSEVRA